MLDPVHGSWEGVEMIEMLFAAALYSAQGSMAAVNSARDAFSKCLREATQQARSSKIKPEAFGEFATQQCTAQATRFKNALVALDVGNRVPRKQAEEDAQEQIDDYIAGSTENFQMHSGSDT